DLELVGLIDVERAGRVIGNVVGDIDQRVDGPEADCLQPPLKPLRRRAVLDVAHQSAREHGAGVGRLSIELKLDGDGIGEAAFDRLDPILFQLTEASSSEVARYA